MSILVNSKNIYLSTQPSSILGGGRDDSFHRFRACINNTPLQTGQDQYAKISLIDFNMYRNFYLINKFNNIVYATWTQGGNPRSANVIIPARDYKTIGEVAAAFEVRLRAALNLHTLQQLDLDGAVSPEATYDKGQTGTGILNINFKTNAGGAHGITNLKLQTRQYVSNTGDVAVDELTFGSSYAILGGKRIAAADENANSFTVDDTTDADKISVAGFYPMQKSTNAYLYLRCAEVVTNLESENFKGAQNLTQDTHIVSSTILAKIPVQPAFAAISSDMDTPHFIFSDNRNISELMFSITDEHNRRIDTIDGIELDGNLFCEMTINYQVLTKGVGQPNNRNVEQNIMGVIQTQGVS